jgi:hypothetical protein
MTCRASRPDAHAITRPLAFFTLTLIAASCAYEPNKNREASGGTGNGGSMSSTAPSGGAMTNAGGTAAGNATTGGAGVVAGSSTGGASAGSGGSGGSGEPLPEGSLVYSKQAIHTRFLSESVTVGDFNQDGNPDVASGRRWWEGPGFTVEHSYRNGHEDLPRTGVQIEIDTGVSDAWAAYTWDMNSDGWDDIIQVASSDAQTQLTGSDPITKGTGYWYENPKNMGNANWQRYQISGDMRGEHKGFHDMTGDGKPEILGSCKLCAPGQSKGFWEANWANPTAQWTYHAATRSYEYPGGAGWFHGGGAGDVDGDGKADYLERSGVWIQPATVGPEWQFLNIALSVPELLDTTGQTGGSNMYTYDVDGDGDNDIVAGLHSHGWGLAWFEQTAPGQFTKRLIMNTPEEKDMYGGVAFSQLHALMLEDMDNDGLKDIVTGKTFLAHPYPTGDAGNMDPAVVYVFKLVRAPTVHFEPVLVDMDSGVGREFQVADVNNDKIKDIVIGCKKGLFVFTGQAK